MLNRIWLGLFTLFLTKFAAGFSLTAPSTVYVADQFKLNWTWLTSESTSIVVVLNDISKAPDCPKDASQREGSYAILDLVNRAGSLGLYVKRQATFQTCAFSYTPGAIKPVTALETLLAKSDTFQSTIYGTTVYVQPTSTSASSPSNGTSSTPSLAGPVIGGVIGGFIFLILLLWLIFFRLTNRYRFIQLPPDDNGTHGNPNSTDPLLMNTIFSGAALPASIGHIHPGVSPFPHSTVSNVSGSATDLSPPTTASLKGRFRDHNRGYGHSSSSGGASGSGAMSPVGSGSRSPTPGPGFGHKTRRSGDTHTRDGSGDVGGGHSSDFMLMSTPMREGKPREGGAVSDSK